MPYFNRKPRQFSHKPIYFSSENETQEQKDVIASKEKDSDYVMGKYIQKQRRNRMLRLDRYKTGAMRKVFTILLIGICLLTFAIYMGIILPSIIAFAIIVYIILSKKHTLKQKRKC